MPNKTLLNEIASACDAMRRCDQQENNSFSIVWRDFLDHIEKDLLPSGSGIDSGTTIDRERSGLDRVVFHTSFHHMNEHGYYDGWTFHRVTFETLFGIRWDITVSGRDRNGIKDYLAEVFASCLDSEVIRGEDATAGKLRFA